MYIYIFFRWALYFSINPSLKTSTEPEKNMKNALVYNKREIKEGQGDFFVGGGGVRIKEDSKRRQMRVGKINICYKKKLARR